MTAAGSRERGRFLVLAGGEVLKIRRQPANRPLVLVAAGGLLLFAAYALLFGGLTRTRRLQGARDTLDALDILLQVGLGIPALVLAARVVAQDYQLGTIRVLIGRGVGRVRLLAAKLVALALVLAAGFAASAVLGCLLAVLLVPGLWSALPGLPLLFWKEAGLDLAATALSLSACLMLGCFAAAVSRSMTFSLAVALAWLPFENLAGLLLAVLASVTRSQAFSTASAYLLSANLDVLPQTLAPWRKVPTFFLTPLVGVDARHALAVAGAYLAFFLAASLLLTWRRDVGE